MSLTLTPLYSENRLTVLQGALVIRRAIALVVGLLLVQGVTPIVLAQASTASVAGVILNPAGQPAFGFRVVLRDVASNTPFTSEPSDASGNYSVEVPLGGRYKIESVIADDGVTRLPVLDAPPVSVLTAGTTPLNVRFTTTPAGGEDDKAKREGVPWYKTPGGITGIVIGSAVVVGLALAAGGGDGDDTPVSPSTPE